MDAGLLGGIIGISVMGVFCICIRVYDIMNKRNPQTSVHTPLLVTVKDTSPPEKQEIRTPTHWKVNQLFKNQKKTILLKNLNSMTANRNLTNTIKQENSEWKLTTVQSV